MVGVRATLLLLLLTPWGCEGGTGAPLARPDGAAPSSPARLPPAAPLQRPRRTYYLAYASGRCIVYWIDGSQHSLSRQESCPRELEPGERVRLAGRVCFRESNDQGRAGPMRCPHPLVAAARDDRRDAGEDRLPVAGAAASTGGG